MFSPTMVGDFKISFDRLYEVSPDGDLSQQTDPEHHRAEHAAAGLRQSSSYLPEFQVNDPWGTGLIANNPAGNYTVFGNQRNPDVTNNFTFDADITKTAGRAQS